MRYSHISDTIINMVHAGAWVLLLIGMIMAKKHHEDSQFTALAGDQFTFVIFSKIMVPQSHTFFSNISSFHF